MSTTQEPVAGSASIGLVGLSVKIAVDDSEVYISRLRDSIIKKAGNKRLSIKYHNGTVGDFSAVEFRCDDRVCDMIICTRNDFNHCEILYVHMQPNPTDHQAPASGALVHLVVGRISESGEKP